jgi:hypothetical protein
MKSRILILICAIAALQSLAFAKERRADGEAPREPAISIVKAIELVMNHHKEADDAIKPVFVDEATYVRDGKGYWKIGLRLKAYESGHLYYKVDEQGKVSSHSVVKDG